MAEIGYLVGPTRLHLPHPFDGEPSSEPGYGPHSRSLCGMFSGGVYAKSWVFFHYGTFPICAFCLRAAGEENT